MAETEVNNHKTFAEIIISMTTIIDRIRKAEVKTSIQLPESLSLTSMICLESGRSPNSHAVGKSGWHNKESTIPRIRQYGNSANCGKSMLRWAIR